MNILKKYQIKAIVKIALEAGEIAMFHFKKNNFDIERKIDNSPLTTADCLISQIIDLGLKDIFPDIPIICEEGKNRNFGNGTFWLIDPIDGTSSFIDNNPEFTINIALIKNQKPIFGLIFAPAIKGSPLYYTNENNNLVRYFIKKTEEKKEEIFVAKRRNENNFIIIASKRSNDDEILSSYRNLPSFFETQTKCEKNIKPVDFYKVSSSLKFLYLIEGKANLYLHLRRSFEWDIAAGQALLESVGGEVFELEGKKILYQKNDLLNKAFLAVL